MSPPPSQPYQSDGSSSQFLLPPATPPSPKRTVGSYLNYSLWKNLWQQAARHRYWMKGAAIAYGITCCFLLSSFMAIAAASLWAPVAQLLTNGLQRWVPIVIPPLQAVIAEIGTNWPLNHRWWLFALTAGLSLTLWCKVVGLTQQIIRSDGDLASHLIPTLRQRGLTGLVAITTAGLTLLAAGLVLFSLPEGIQQLAQVSVLGLIRQLLVQSLRWSLAASTIALSYGVLYRSSQKSSARSAPVLPGTVLATVIWLATAMAFKHHLESWANYHWLFSAASTLTLSLIGLYTCTLGLLLGGQYNKLINRYFPPGRSPQSSPQGPPPSFESFTIPKQRPYR